MQLSGVRLSVCLSHLAAARRSCRFAAAGPASRRYRSIAAVAAGEMRAVPRCQRMYVAEHRLLLFVLFCVFHCNPELPTYLIVMIFSS